MPDYIERDKALTLDFRIKVDMFESRRKTAESAVQAYADAIAAIPSADVRPVVTCGECVYFRLNSCMRWADGTFMERTDFCSRAAKREES